MADIEKDKTATDEIAEKASKEADAKPAADPLAKIEWSAMSGSLDFLDDDGAAEGEAADQDSKANSRIEKLQALASSVSKAVSKRKKKSKKDAGADAEEISATDIAPDMISSEAEIELEMLTDDGGIITPEGSIALEAIAEMTDGQTDDGTETGAETATATGAVLDPWLKAEEEMQQMGFQALEEELDAAENDAAAEPTEFIMQDQLFSIIESLLFSTDKPVSVASIKMIFKGSNIRTKDITRALDILASEYASPNRGVTLEEINGGYQLRTKVDNVDHLRRLAKIRPFRLSGPALEVMAIVAYKQPVTKHEIDEIRGVESGHLLRALMERGMVNFQGKAEHLPGKPMSYGTTRRFLETFGLRNTRELPTLTEIDDLLPEGIGAEEEEKESLSDLTDKLSNDIVASYSEGEEELGKIKDTLSAIDTTSEFFEQEKVRERERRDRDRAQDIREQLMVGEAVEEKDKRWLDRYEAKLVAQEAAAAAGTAMIVSADETEAAPSVAGEVANLTEENQIEAKSNEQADADEADAAEIEFALENESLDDLEANGDWNDDTEGEAQT
ncbi:MAG: SMC-Scp complex subunit ScpB [Bdellovibrionota bacterium]